MASLYGTPKEEMQLSAGSVGSGSLPFLFSEDNDNEDVDGDDERDEDDDEEGKSNFTSFKFICSKHMFYFGGQGLNPVKSSALTPPHKLPDFEQLKCSETQ